MNAIILAGGKNTRMQGEDKAFLEIEGRPLVARLIAKLRPLTDEIIVVTNASFKKYSRFEVRLVKDESPHQGPLMGIYSGLRASSSDHNFVTAGDTPFLNEALVRHMIKNRDDYEVVIPKIDGKFHPLFGIYSKKCIPVIEERLGQNKLKVSDIFPKIKTKFLSKPEIEQFDGPLLSLMNINTREDLARAREMAGGIRKLLKGVIAYV